MPNKIRRHHKDEHHVSIIIRPASLSHEDVQITIHQERDPAGNWLIPTITINTCIPQTSEDVIFMKNIAEGLYLACFEFLEMMDYVT
jgi:hypothetical protein